MLLTDGGHGFQSRSAMMKHQHLPDSTRTLILSLTFLLLALCAAVGVTLAAPANANLSNGSNGSHDTNPGLFCDFEQLACRWEWTRFRRLSASEINATIFSSDDPSLISGPVEDGDGNIKGKKKDESTENRVLRKFDSVTRLFNSF